MYCPKSTPKISRIVPEVTAGWPTKNCPQDTIELQNPVGFYATMYSIPTVRAGKIINLLATLNSRGITMYSRIATTKVTSGCCSRQLIMLKKFGCGIEAMAVTSCV